MSEKKCSSLTLMIVPARGNSWSELLTSALSSGLNQSFYTLLSRSIQCELEEFSQNVSNPAQLHPARPVKVDLFRLPCGDGKTSIPRAHSRCLRSEGIVTEQFCL
jgi:hypothetical protein